MEPASNTLTPTKTCIEMHHRGPSRSSRCRRSRSSASEPLLWGAWGIGDASRMGQRRPTDTGRLRTLGTPAAEELIKLLDDNDWNVSFFADFF